jgi:hypothetical protein
MTKNENYSLDGYDPESVYESLIVGNGIFIFIFELVLIFCCL